LDNPIRLANQQLQQQREQKKQQQKQEKEAASVDPRLATTSSRAV
jgi:hypothetical protein